TTRNLPARDDSPPFSLRNAKNDHVLIAACH
ncbi:MAG: hypothetical protein ACI8TX_002982, partial [Hyphomicrobiaceae bacterium]